MKTNLHSQVAWLAAIVIFVLGASLLLAQVFATDEVAATFTTDEGTTIVEDDEAAVIFDTDLYKEYKAQEVTTLAELAQDFEWQQTLWMPIAPPSTEFWGWTQDASQLPMPFEPSNFPKDFVANLGPAYRDGVVVYPITVWEDEKTHDRVFYNADGKEIGSVPAAKGYDPRWCLYNLHPDIQTSGLSSEAVDAMSQIYDPSHLLIRYELILDSDLIKWVLAQSIRPAAAAAKTATKLSGGGGMTLMRSQAADSDIVFDAITRETNGIKLEIGYPNDFTNHLEIFTCTNLVSFWWALTATNLSTSGTNTICWTDTSTGQLIRFYAVGNADTNTTTDPDGDGLTWAREKYMYHTSPTNSDTDGDGLSDYQEVIVFNTDPNNNDIVKPIVTIDTPNNNETWVWMP